MNEPAAVALVGMASAHQGGPALHAVSLALHPGEILALLGGPGAGKSRLLRILAGFEQPGSGQVLVDERDARLWRPTRRGIGLVEHGLGLFARLTVRQTLALAARPASRADALLDAAGLARVAGRRPAELDPGQRAMLATARALAASPRVVLFDETASGLDQPTREALFALIRGGRAAGLSVVFATADATQALAIGDRMAVLASGTIAQEGRPQAIYNEPADATVAALTGALNALPGQVQVRTDEGVQVRLDDGALVEAREGGVAPAGRCLVCLRPEHLAVSAVPPEQLGAGAMAAQVEWVTFHGDHLRLGLRAAGVPLVAIRPAGVPLRGVAAGRTVAVAWQPHHATAFPPAAGLM